MDSIRFDGVARQLQATDTRRGAVKLVAAAVLGFGLTRFGLDDTEARRKRKHRKSKKRKNRKQKTERPTKVLGEICESSKQCLYGLQCAIANSQNGYPERATTPVCCVPADVNARCNSGADCCGVGVICNGGYCQSA